MPSATSASPMRTIGIRAWCSIAPISCSGVRLALAASRPAGGRRRGQGELGGPLVQRHAGGGRLVAVVFLGRGVGLEGGQHLPREERAPQPTGGVQRRESEDAQWCLDAAQALQAELAAVLETQPQGTSRFSGSSGVVMSKCAPAAPCSGSSGRTSVSRRNCVSLSVSTLRAGGMFRLTSPASASKAIRRPALTLPLGPSTSQGSGAVCGSAGP